MARDPTPHYASIEQFVREQREEKVGQHSKVSKGIGDEDPEYRKRAVFAIMDRAKAEESAAIARQQRGYSGYAPGCRSTTGHRDD